MADNTAHPGHRQPRSSTEFAREILSAARSPSPAPLAIQQFHQEMVGQTNERLHRSAMRVRYPETFRGQASVYRWPPVCCAVVQCGEQAGAGPVHDEPRQPRVPLLQVAACSSPPTLLWCRYSGAGEAGTSLAAGPRYRSAATEQVSQLCLALLYSRAV